MGNFEKPFIILMTNIQWDELIAVIAGKSGSQKDIGFIIDSPWLPGWSGIAYT